MKKKGLVYIILVLLVLFVLLVYLILEEERQSEFIRSQKTSSFSETIVIGSSILDDYRQNIQSINEGKYSIHIKNRHNNDIEFSNYDELNNIVYSFQQYDREEYKNINTVTVNYYISNYTNLIETVTKSNLFNEAKLKLYYVEDYKDQRTSVLASRNLKSNEVYGKDVIGNYTGHKADIESGKVYFLVSDVHEQYYTSLDKLKNDIFDNDIYVKEFELTSAGNLKGYKFTKVKE